MENRGFLRRIGPAFIVGACLIGPGSVTLMSRTGALYGYSMLWLAVLSGALMAGFIGLFMRFGIYSDETFLGLAAKKLGRPFAVLCGLTLFSVDATFQFGNALGVATGMEQVFASVPKAIWPIAFTLAAIIFLFSLKHFYRVIEKLMMFLLVFMFLAFFVNLVWARPDLGAAARGFVVPTIPKGADWVALGGLIGTTFVIVCAFFQSYLVKAKGWHEGDLRSGSTDTILASLMFTLIGCVIMMTAASVFQPGTRLPNAEAMASQLAGVFGQYAKFVFCLGYWAAAFSSFVTNSLIGGVLLNDGLGLGGRLESLPTKIFATGVLLIGMTTGLVIIHHEDKAKQTEPSVATAQPEGRTPPAAKGREDLKVKAIAVAQAATMLGVPLGTIAMVLVLFDKRATGGRGLPLYAKAFVVLGALVLLGIAALMFVKLRPVLMGIFGYG